MFLTQYRPGTRSFTPDVFEKDGEFFRLPRTNVNESDSEFVVTMEMPGVDKGDVDVLIENDKVVITGDKTDVVVAEGLRRREIRSSKFRRSFALDNAVDAKKVTAKMENGILTVTLPKCTEIQGRKVDVG